MTEAQPAAVRPTDEPLRDNTQELRELEHAKYVRAYQLENYRMGGQRYTIACRELGALFDELGPAGYADIGCGRGEMLLEAKRLGFGPITGVEVVPHLVESFNEAHGILPGTMAPMGCVWGQAHDLPFSDDSLAVVSLFDVLEHLLPGDDEKAIREACRVATDSILITANNRDSINGDDQLHINKRDYDEWQGVLAFNTPDLVKITVVDDWKHGTVSPMWRIDLP